MNRIGTSTAAVSVSYGTVDGTALAGTDYTATSGTLQWAQNDSTPQTITVPISTASPFAGIKNFQVALSNPSSSAEIGSPDSATVIISGDASTAGGTLQLSATSYTTSQTASTLTITVNRTGGSSGATTVDYSTTSGTAVSGTDFTGASGTLSWADGDATSKTFAIAIGNSAAFNGSKSFTVALANPTGAAALGTPSSASVAIAGDASAATGSLALSAQTYSVAQTAGSVAITVDRVGGSGGNISVNFATSSGTAVAGTNFTASSGTLTWADGDVSPRTIPIVISTANPFSNTKSFSLTLSGPTGGATVSSPGVATVTISGSYLAPVGSLQLTAAQYAVSQSAGTLTVSVDRSGGSSGAASVTYATIDGTASSGTDYTATNGTLNWADGDVAVKTFAIAVSNTIPFSGNKTFTVAISNPSTGVSLGSPSTASVTITGSGANSGGGPSAVSNLTLTNQGGANNNISVNQDSLSNSQTITWDAAAAGSYPIAHYQIYRNGVAYATTSALTYTDSNATNSNDVQQNDGSGAFNAPRTVYSYTVAAVDTQGNVGPQASQLTYFEHSGGVDYWGHEAFNPPSPAVIMNWTSTAVAHGNSPSIISITTNQSSQYLQPYSAPPSVPLYSFEAGAFANGYMQFDVYPTKAGQQFRLNLISRVTIGDLYNNAAVYGIGSNPAYGPVPLVQNAWNHIKVPMGAGTSAAPGLQMGFATFQGYVSGKVLTVTSISNQIQINASMWISAPGMTTDYIASTGSGSGTTGTYNMNVSQTVGSASAPVTFTGQRTNLYKWSFQDSNESGANVWYMDNIEYTTH